MFGDIGIKDLVEDRPGVSGLSDVIDAELVFGRRVAGESFGDLDADELRNDCDQPCALLCLKSFERRAICGLYFYDSESHWGLTRSNSENLAMSGLRTLMKLIGSAWAIWTMPGNCRAIGTISDTPLII